MEPAPEQIQHGQEPVYVLQPDYQFSHNGYGLLQLVANFAVDSSQAGTSSTRFARGAGFLSEGGYTTSYLGSALSSQSWTCVKAEERGRDGKMTYMTAHYAAIDKDKGTFTETEATMTSAVVSEPIESHPNFTKVQINGIGDGENPLGGIWDGETPPSPTDTAKNKYRAQWGPITSSANVGAVTYNFLAFLPSPSGSAPNRKAGVRSWMRPTVTLRLTSYTTDQTSATDVTARVGMIIDGSVGYIAIPEAYQGITTNSQVAIEGGGKPNWLVTAANMEIYGGLYKVTADLLLSGVLGWDKDIYQDVSS